MTITMYFKTLHLLPGIAEILITYFAAVSHSP